MKLVYLGTGDFAVPALYALVKAGHDVLRVISQPDRPAGRGRKVQPTYVHTAANELELMHVQAEDLNALDVDVLTADAEFGIVTAFGQKIGPAFLDALPRGCVNIHGSLLPKYRGAAPYQWAIINGETTTGVTVFQLNERWDAGAIWSRSETPIDETETAEELHDRLARLGAILIVETLQQIEAGTVKPVPQNMSLATRAPKLSKADGLIDWNQSAHSIARRINGLWSWPAASAEFVSRSGKRERVLLARARATEDEQQPDVDFPPGAFRASHAVQTGEGCVQLLEVRPASGKLMPFEAFANGRRIAVGDHLVRPEAP